METIILRMATVNGMAKGNEDGQAVVFIIRLKGFGAMVDCTRVHVLEGKL